MLILLLQNLSRSSKFEKNLEALTRRSSLWNKGKIGELLYEDQTIQDCLKASVNTTNITKLSKNFKLLISRRNKNSALKLLTKKCQMEYSHYATKCWVNSN